MKPKWNVQSENPDTVAAWQASDPKPQPAETPGQPPQDLTGGPGTTGFSKRIGRLNKLYHNLTPEQRANHPGFRRLLEVIKLEQELDDRTNENMLGYTQPEGPAAAPPEPMPTSTGQDKRQQETALGLRRPLNNVLDRFDKGGGAK